MVGQKRWLNLNEEESMDELVEAINKPDAPTGDARTLAFLIKN